MSISKFDFDNRYQKSELKISSDFNAAHAKWVRAAPLTPDEVSICGVCGLSTQGYKCNKGIIALFLVSHLGMWVGVGVFENKAVL